MRHYAKIKGEEIIILGYNKGRNDVMVCLVAGLPVDEQMHLRQIASSSEAQKLDYLIPMLQSIRHPKTSIDWFTFLATKLWRKERSMGCVPIKELEDMHPDQKAFYKGYGESIEPKPQETEVVAQEPAPVMYEMDDIINGNVSINPVTTTSAGVSGQTPPAPVAAPPAQNDAMAALLAAVTQLTEQQAETNKVLKSLKPARKTPAKRKTTPRKTAASKAKNEQASLTS